jgi:parallel beta-helix repeat protein
LVDTGFGVDISGGAQFNIVGTSGIDVDVAGERNVISGNTGTGVRVTGSSNNLVAGNYIRTDKTGTSAFANQNNGVAVSSANVTIGGTAAGAGNLISGNTVNGIFVSTAAATGVVIIGNVIGLESDGSTPMPNGGRGVLVQNGPSNIRIGTDPNNPNPRERNVISGNTRDGIGRLEGGTGSCVRTCSRVSSAEVPWKGGRPVSRV